MHRVGLANQPTSTHLDDGLELHGARVLAAVRCAPPANRPTPEERATCAPWLERELRLVLPTLRVVVALGAIGWDASLAALRSVGFAVPVPRPRFGHGASVLLPGDPRPVVLLGSYHPSQQNTFTGRLTEQMLDDVLGRAAELGVEP
jgi:uracil-DNA glycosylase